MPYPYMPYHIGPSCLLGFLLRRWVDFPVFVLSNFAIDFVVLILGLWRSTSLIREHAHTILIGAVVGILWGIAAYLFRRLFRRFMLKIRLPYKTNISKMLFSGILGTWLHIFVDSLYHSDINLFWPCQLTNLLFRFSRRLDDLFLILCFIAAFIFYIHVLKSQKKHGKLVRYEAGEHNGWAD
jgi:membrane-bound metal-dependent hydrolase YbcI (DUF457 family)